MAEELADVSAAIHILDARTHPGDETGTASTRQAGRLMAGGSLAGSDAESDAAHPFLGLGLG